jgi:hypothetical protein
MKPIRWTVVLLVLAMTAPVGARAHLGGTDSFLHETFTEALTEISPGLCAPGDTAECVGPDVAQFRGSTTSASTCRLNGMFENQMYADAPCAFDLYGFMSGLAPGTKPACGAARFWLSDETTAFGEDKFNTFTFDGMARHIYVEGLSLGAILIFTKVEIDDDDPDTDVTGDHVDFAPPTPILRDATGGEGTSCVQAPLTRGRMLSGMSIFI